MWFNTPAQGILGPAIAAVIIWLRKHDREVESEALELEGKTIFALANDPQRILSIVDESMRFKEEYGEDAWTLVGIKPIWDKMCEKHRRDPVTGRKL